MRVRSQTYTLHRERATGDTCTTPTQKNPERDTTRSGPDAIRRDPSRPEPGQVETSTQFVLYCDGLPRLWHSPLSPLHTDTLSSVHTRTRVPQPGLELGSHILVPSIPAEITASSGYVTMSATEITVSSGRLVPASRRVTVASERLSTASSRLVVTPGRVAMTPAVVSSVHRSLEVQEVTGGALTAVSGQVVFAGDLVARSALVHTPPAAPASTTVTATAVRGPRARAGHHTHVTRSSHHPTGARHHTAGSHGRCDGSPAAAGRDQGSRRPTEAAARSRHAHVLDGHHVWRHHRVHGGLHRIARSLRGEINTVRHTPAFQVLITRNR